MISTAKSRCRTRVVLTLALGLGLAAPATASAGGDTTPPTAPTKLRAIDIDPRRVTIDWTESSDNVGVQGYCIEVNGAAYGGECNDPSSFGFRPPPITVFHLEEGTKYRIEVRAKDAAHNISDAAAVTITTDVVDAPRNLRVVEQHGDDVTLAWDEPTYCDGGCNFRYRIFDGTNLETLAGSKRTATIGHVTPGTHAFRVSSRDTPLSAPVTVTVDAADRTRPTTPTNYQVRFELLIPDASLFGRFTLNWSQARDDVSQQSTIEYDMLDIDSETGQMYTSRYSFARGTGTFAFEGPASTHVGPIRAADEAGNRSLPTGWPRTVR